MTSAVSKTQLNLFLLLKLAADAGHGLAVSQCGEALEFVIGITKDIPEAIMYDQKSSDLACPLGMFNFGDKHQHGRRVTQNVVEAVRLYKLAADNDLEEAFFAVCEISREGEEGMRVDLERLSRQQTFQRVVDTFAI
jgi:TPR repeat protein